MHPLPSLLYCRQAMSRSLRGLRFAAPIALLLVAAWGPLSQTLRIELKKGAPETKQATICRLVLARDADRISQQKTQSQKTPETETPAPETSVWISPLADHWDAGTSVQFVAADLPVLQILPVAETDLLEVTVSSPHFILPQWQAPPLLARGPPHTHA